MSSTSFARSVSIIAGEVVDEKARMGALRRDEVVFGADVQDEFAGAQPEAATTGKRRGLVNFRKAERSQ